MQRGTTLAAIARQLDHLQRYDEAMETMQQAKELQVGVIGAERIRNEISDYKNKTERLNQVMESDACKACLCAL